jgi:hypothetical protein
MGELFRRIKYLINRRRLDAELESDMEFHREMAARAGRSNFGNTLRMREQAREAWGWTWLDRLIQDLRYGVRTWPARPASRSWPCWCWPSASASMWRSSACSTWWYCN